MEINNEIIKMFNNGLNVTEIANKFGYDRKLLSRELNKLGYITNPKINANNINEKDIKEIINLYKNGKSLREIGRIKDISHHYVRDILIKEKIIIIDDENIKKDIYNLYFIDNRSIPYICSKLNINVQKVKDIFLFNKWNFRPSGRKRIFNENIFETIDTHLKAYWLGFIYADGYNNETKGELEIDLKDSDSEHLLKLLKLVEAKNIVIKNKKIKLNNKIFYASRIFLSSRKLSNDLKKLGCTQNKSLKIKFINNTLLSKEFIPSFIAGYFDGDGSVGKYNRAIQLSFVSGSADFIYSLENELKKILNNLHINKKRNSNCYSLSCSGKQNIINFYNYCYRYLNKECYLLRKQNIFNRIING